MTSLAIDILSRDDDGFFLMVEAGRIDHGHHAGNAHRALVDTIAHEYAHYLIHRTAPRCPPWLHEGIAQWVEGRRGAGRERLSREARAGRLPRLFGMTRSFAETANAARARRLYEEALAFVEFLVARDGATAPGNLVRSLATRELSEALEAVTGSEPEDLEAEWHRSLRGG